MRTKVRVLILIILFALSFSACKQSDTETTETISTTSENTASLSNITITTLATSTTVIAPKKQTEISMRGKQALEYYSDYVIHDIVFGMPL